MLSASAADDRDNVVAGLRQRDRSRVRNSGAHPAADYCDSPAKRDFRCHPQRPGEVLDEVPGLQLVERTGRLTDALDDQGDPAGCGVAVATPARKLRRV